MPDVNILVYAHRQDEASHQPYRDWLHELIDSDEPFGLSVLVAVGFVRVVTNSKIYSPPTPLSVAVATIDAISTRSNCRVLAPGARHWALVKRTCTEANAMGKLVADAQHAALAIEHGCQWVTRDSDFGLFASSGLRWRHLVF